MSNLSHQAGQEGERRALRYYRWRGYRLLARNYRAADGEIDLIVSRWKTVVFVEVKMRGQGALGEPWEAVDADKRRRIVGAAERFVARERLEDRILRFDVVAIASGGPASKMTCYRDAFRPEGEPGRPWRWK